MAKMLRQRKERQRQVLPALFCEREDLGILKLELTWNPEYGKGEERRGRGNK